MDGLAPAGVGGGEAGGGGAGAGAPPLLRIIAGGRLLQDVPLLEALQRARVDATLERLSAQLKDSAAFRTPPNAVELDTLALARAARPNSARVLAGTIKRNNHSISDGGMAVHRIEVAREPGEIEASEEKCDEEKASEAHWPWKSAPTPRPMTDRISSDCGKARPDQARP